MRRTDRESQGQSQEPSEEVTVLLQIGHVEGEDL